MRLHDPWAFALLALAPLLVWAYRRIHRTAAVRFPTLAEVREIPYAGRRRWQWVLPAMRSLVLLLFLVALARPQFGSAAGRYTGEGIDVVLAVDISGSMLAEDFQLGGQRANRLEAVKSVVQEFVEARSSDRIGLVLFAGRPYTQCPLTLDHGWLLQNLRRASIGMIEDGTAIGSALAAAAGRLQPSDAKSKIVVLLTDGQNNAGKISPLTAADAASALHIKVYTIGAGTRGLAPFPARDMFGNTVYRPVAVDIDEQTLQSIAEKTSGRYFRATDTTSLRRIYEEIDRMERAEFAGLRHLEYRDAYPWLVGPALLLLLAELTLAHTRLRTLP